MTGNMRKAIKPKKIEAVIMSCPYCKEKFIEEYHKYMAMVRCYHCNQTSLCFKEDCDKKEDVKKIKVPMVYGLHPKRNIFYFSGKKYWEENHYCEDTMNDNIRDVLYDVGLSESQEAIWECDKKGTKNKIKEKLDKLGFEYNQKFEDFMTGHKR